MRYIDAHLHIGNPELVKAFVPNSIYREKIRLYDALDYRTVAKQEDFILPQNIYICIPIVIKEIGISEANDYLLAFVSSHSNCIANLFVGDSVEKYSKNNSFILKEHFLHHKAEEWKDRSSSYEYLNDKEGYLLIHSSDKKRIGLIETLRNNFPKMRIIIAHMGRNVFEDVDFSKNIIGTFSDDDHIFYDISTIKKSEIIEFALDTIGDERILYGSDFPYECNPDWDINMFFDTLNRLNLPSKTIENILFNNAFNIIS